MIRMMELTVGGELPQSGRRAGGARSHHLKRIWGVPPCTGRSAAGAVLGRATKKLCACRRRLVPTWFRPGACKAPRWFRLVPT